MQPIMRRWAWVSASCVLLTVMFLANTANSEATTRCRSLRSPTVSNIKESGSSCQTARSAAGKMARAMVSRCLGASGDSSERCRLTAGGRSWTCHLSRPGYADKRGNAHFPYRCSASGAAVWFHVLQVGAESGY